MNAEQLLQHFHRIGDSPGAIPRLRRFILDLAVRGKLVSQDPNDEPASELLRRIAAEKTRLVKAGRSRHDHPEPISGEQEPFAVPSSWRWTRLGAIAELVRGISFPASDKSTIPGLGLLPCFRSGNVQSEIIWGNFIFVPRVVLKGVHQFVREGDILMSIANSYALVGKCAIVKSVQEEVTFGAFLAAIRLHVALPEYVCHFLSSEYSANEFRRGSAQTTNIANITFSTIRDHQVALPPLAEQRRIVAKIDELRALCDRLEAARAERETRRDRLAAASLTRLNAPDPDPAAFAGHARFALNNLAALTMRADQIKNLRQTILNLAVLGKLVPQDPNDEPASELLTKRTKLPDGHKRRRKILKEMSAQAPRELLPVVPPSWECTTVQRLYDLNVIIDYADGNHGSSYPRSSEFGDRGVTFVTAKDLVNGRVNWTSCAKLNEERANQLTKGWAKGDDVLLTHNATVGRVARVEPGADRFLLGTSVTFYRLNPSTMYPGFFFYLLQSPLWQGQLEAIMVQTTRNQVSIQKQAFFLVIVPPLAEQLRIVAKIDELIALCDRLESSIATGDDTRRHLLDVLLSEALTPTNTTVMEAVA